VIFLTLSVVIRSKLVTQVLVQGVVRYGNVKYVKFEDDGKKRMCGSADVATGIELWLGIMLRLRLGLGLGIRLGLGMGFGDGLTNKLQLNYQVSCCDIRASGMGNLRKCRMRKVICGMKSAE